MTPAVAAALDRLAAGLPPDGPEPMRTACRIRGRDVVFCTAMEHDPIQRKNRAGAFYETSDLYLLDGHFPKGGTFVDIGANIGNHSLYFALMLDAGLVVPVEPNPLCWRLLLHNVLANGLAGRFDLTRLGVGVGAERAGGYGMEDRARNLGAAAMIAGAGDLEIWPGDVLVQGVIPDFIKIDVEGAEIAALEGLAETIRRHRPKLFVEVADENDSAFAEWCGRNGYQVLITRARYRSAKNYLIGPVGEEA